MPTAPCPMRSRWPRTDGAELHVVHVVEKLVGPARGGMDALANEDDDQGQGRAAGQSDRR